jgi:hypothetical protein
MTTRRERGADLFAGYVIEEFVLEDRYWTAVRNREGKLTLTVMPMFEAVGAVFNFKVVPLPGQTVLLGIIMSRARTNFEPPYGFNFNGTSDLQFKKILTVVYPAPQILSGSSLDYG